MYCLLYKETYVLPFIQGDLCTAFYTRRLMYCLLYKETYVLPFIQGDLSREMCKD